MMAQSKYKLVIITGLVLLLGIYSPALAHRAGCHTLHTCPSDNNSYTCGDLGYPCDGSNSINDITPNSVIVPLLVETTFKSIFERPPTDQESTYWKNRFRSEKNSAYKIMRAMRWHETRGSTGPLEPSSSSNLEPLILVRQINSIFRSVYNGRNPTFSENNYWLSRIKDKPNKQALQDAMHYHLINNINH